MIHLHRQRLDASVLTMKRCPGVARLAAKCAAATSRTSAIKRLRTFCSSHISRCTLCRHSPPDGWCIFRFWAAFWVPDSTHPWKHHASTLVTMMRTKSSKFEGPRLPTYREARTITVPTLRAQDEGRTEWPGNTASGHVYQSSERGMFTFEAIMRPRKWNVHIHLMLDIDIHLYICHVSDSLFLLLSCYILSTPPQEK